MLSSLTTSTCQMIRSCRACFSFTGEIRTSRSRSAPRRWQSTVMSSESSTRFAPSESQRSAIRLEQLPPLRLAVLHRHPEGRLQESLLSDDRRPDIFSDRGAVSRTCVIFPRHEPCGLIDSFPQVQARQKFVRNLLEQKSDRIQIHAIRVVAR